MTDNIVTGVARLVQGDAFIGRTTDFNGRPLTTQAGEPRTDFYIAVAVPKHEAAPLIQQIQQVAARDFPNGETQRPDFAWKYIDGDSTVPNMRGTKPCECEGFPGNYVFKFSSGFKPTVYDAQYNEIVDPNRIKVGDYVRVSGTIRGNDNAMKPGLYLSHTMVLFVKPGEAIRTGPDPRAVFGGAPPSNAPQQPPSPHAGVQPHNLVPGPQGAAAPPPPPPPGNAPQMAPGCPYTYDQLKGQGWSDEQMRQAGHLL